MPRVPSTYNPPLVFKNGHLATIYSGLARRVNGLNQQRERLELPDGDFLDLDWSFAEAPAKKVVILLHGLEGNAQRPYITGSARAFNAVGYDACAVNFRGCSGEANRLYRSYHSGATEDLEAVVRHILQTKDYGELYLKGFSLGGNVTLKYLGEGRDLPREIKAAVAVSVPCSLYSSLQQLLMPKNVLYAKRFKTHLLAKLVEKQKLFPEKISDAEIESVATLKDFDDVYTSRANGFDDAMDYYAKCSSLQFLPDVRVPVLVINAKNDSFLGPECYPLKEAVANPSLYLEVPAYGGHVGFFDWGPHYYTEQRAIKFLQGMH